MITFVYLVLAILGLIIISCFIYFGYDVFKMFIGDLRSAYITRNWDEIVGYSFFISVFLVLIILAILSRTGNL